MKEGVVAGGGEVRGRKPMKNFICHERDFKMETKFT